MDNKWKEQLKERFSDYTLPEPEGLWEGIEKSLPPQRRRIVPFVWWGSAAVAAAVAAVVLLHPFRTHSVLGPVTAEALETLPADVPPMAEQVQQLGRRVAVVPQRKVAEQPSAMSSSAVEEEAGPVVETTPEEKTVILDNEGDTTPSGQKELTPDPSSQTEVFPTVFPPEPKERRNRPRLSVGLAGNGAFSGATASGERYAVGPAYAIQGADGRNDNSPSLVKMVSAGKTADYRDSHLAPLRAGVAFTAHLDPHWAVESGVYVSLLRSSFYEKNMLMEQETRQAVYMLGVPLKISWGFQPAGKLRLYASAGMMGEKCLTGSSVTYSMLGGKEGLRFTEENPLDRSGFYWSAGIDLGAEWQIGKVVGLYAEPGLWYHFPADTQLSTIYTAHPLTASITAGLRFHLGR